MSVVAHWTSWWILLTFGTLIEDGPKYPGTGQSVHLCSTNNVKIHFCC